MLLRSKLLPQPPQTLMAQPQEQRLQEGGAATHGSRPAQPLPPPLGTILENEANASLLFPGRLFSTENTAGAPAGQLPSADSSRPPQLRCVAETIHAADPSAATHAVGSELAGIDELCAPGNSGATGSAGQQQQQRMRMTQASAPFPTRLRTLAVLEFCDGGTLQVRGGLRAHLCR
jgi:hypothetical protein